MDIRSASMACADVDGEPSAKKAKTAAQRVFVSVKDRAAVVYYLSNNWCVSDLLEKVIEKEKLSVGLGLLRFYTSKAAFDAGQALDPMDDVPANGVDAGTGKQIPFYVDYPDAPVSHASLEESLETIAKTLSCVVENQRIMSTITPVTESAAGTQTRGADWHMKVVDYYECSDCMILSQLYPTETRPHWFDKKSDFKGARGPFPAVAEHIIPKGQDSVGKIWDVDIHQGYNGLLLLRHLERTYQAGRWTMVPVTEGEDKGKFQIYVDQDLQDEQIMYYPTVGEPEHSVKISGTVLKFRMLHGMRVELIGKYKANPSLRALFLKAEMAHRVSQDLPNPLSCMAIYSMKCPRMLAPNWEIWQRSQPDNELPVIQPVPHVGS